MELFHGYQVGLQFLDLGGQILGNFLNGFITREEIEKLVDLSAKDVNASEFFNSCDPEGVPVSDVVEGTPFVQWDGVEGVV